MKKTVVGTCVEISEARGWTAFSIDAGSQYPIKLSTKLPKVIEQARAVGSQEAAWVFDETESDKINENTGKPYINRRLEGVRSADDEEMAADDGGGADEFVVSTRENAAPLVPKATAKFPPLMGGEKDRTIARMNALSNAVQTLDGKHGDADDLVVGVRVLELASRYERWVYRDIEEIQF